MMDERERVMERSFAIERQMFALLEEHLSDEQKERVPQVLRRRARIRSTAERSGYPAGQIDLVRLVEAEHARAPFQILHPDHFESVILSYDMMVTPAFEQRMASWQNAYTKSPVLMAAVPWHLDPSDSRYQEEYSKASAARTRLLTQTVEAEKRIVALNEQYVQLFRSTLTPEDADKLQKLYMQTAYPTVYPDLHDVEPLIREVSALPSLSEKAREEIEEMKVWYPARRDDLSRQMVAELNRYWGKFYSTFMYHPHDRPAMESRLEKLDEARSALSGVVVATLQKELDEAQWSSVTANVKIPHTERKRESVTLQGGPGGPAKPQ